MGGGAAAAGRGLVEKPKAFGKTMSKLVDYLRPFWLALVFVLIFAIASTVFAVLSPKILGKMTNQVVSDFTSIKVYEQVYTLIPKNTSLPAGTTGAELIRELPSTEVQKIPPKFLGLIKNLDLTRRPVMNYGKLAMFAIELLALYLISAALSYIQGWIMTNVSQKVTYQFRRDISEKINRMPLHYFDSRTFGEVLSRVTNDVDTVSQTLNQGLTQIVTSITMIIGILIMMLTISFTLTLVSLILIPIFFTSASLYISPFRIPR